VIYLEYFLQVSYSGQAMAWSPLAARRSEVLFPAQDQVSYSGQAMAWSPLAAPPE